MTVPTKELMAIVLDELHQLHQQRKIQTLMTTVLDELLQRIQRMNADAKLKLQAFVLSTFAFSAVHLSSSSPPTKEIPIVPQKETTGTNINPEIFTDASTCVPGEIPKSEQIANQEKMQLRLREDEVREKEQALLLRKSAVAHKRQRTQRNAERSRQLALDRTVSKQSGQNWYDSMAEVPANVVQTYNESRKNWCTFVENNGGIVDSDLVITEWDTPMVANVVDSVTVREIFCV